MIECGMRIADRGVPVVDWLLELENPSVRYFTLVELLGKRVGNQDVIEAKSRIMTEGPVPRILSRMKPPGYWGKAEDYYVGAKYKGTVWNIILLASLGADGRDKRVRAAAEFVIRYAQDPESGGFACRGGPKGGRHDSVIACLTGNMTWSLIRFGMLDDPRVQRAIAWIVKYQRYDDGETRPAAVWPYDGRERCWGRHTCHNSVVKTLRALAEIPTGQRSPAVRHKIEQAAEHLLRHHIFKRSHDLRRVSISYWTRFGAPAMWDCDCLEILEILTRLGFQDPRMQAAIDLVRKKQGEDGRWLQEGRFTDRLLVRLERNGRPSRWVTLRALTVLARLGQLAGPARALAGGRRTALLQNTGTSV